MPECPGKAYNAAIEKDFEYSSPDSQQEFFASLQGGDSVRIQASRANCDFDLSHTGRARSMYFFANFAGLGRRIESHSNSADRSDGCGEIEVRT